MKNLNPTQKLKSVFTALTLFISIISCAQSKEEYSIAAKESVIIDHSQFDLYAANLKNSSMANLEISVLDKESGEQVRGFGLSPLGKATVMVEGSSRLEIKNLADKTAKIKVNCSSQNPKMMEKPATAIEFSLINTTDKSIPLFIPSVMNPNLSPNSESRVSLKVGQEILYRYKGQRKVVLTVSEEIKEGDKIDVAKLITKMKEQR